MFADLLTTMLAAFLLLRLAWLEDLLHEAIDLVVFIGLGWTFRMVRSRSVAVEGGSGGSGERNAAACSLLPSRPLPCRCCGPGWPDMP